MLESIKLLVLSKCSLEAKDKWGMTALMYACREGFYDCVEFLLEHGSDVFAENKVGQRALEFCKNETIIDLVESCEMTS